MDKNWISVDVWIRSVFPDPVTNEYICKAEAIHIIILVENLHICRIKNSVPNQLSTLCICNQHAIFIDL